MTTEVKFIRAGRYVSPNGEDLGPVPAKTSAEQPSTKQPSTEEPKQPQGQEQPTDERTVDELKAALDAAKVEYPSTAKKADLLKLAAEKGV